ncbi:MAG: hypothetical protein GY818_13400 [Planctomycetaceae bacterium]|nr:hypothetical protein [Planctomycetaceae bacterium]
MTSYTLTPLLVSIAVKENRNRPYDYQMDDVYTAIGNNGQGFFMGYTIKKENGKYIAI